MMAIKKYYEVTCDFCGNADFGTRSIVNAEKEYKQTKGVVKMKKHFCDMDCYTKYLTEGRKA